MTHSQWPLAAALCVLPATAWLAAPHLPGRNIQSPSSSARPSSDARIERKTCVAPDGVTIVYSTAGRGEVALVFIHGGLADRTFYDAQLHALSDRYRVIALDLAGHGESGTNRKSWGIPEFGGDVKSVVEAEKLTRVVLLGNSLGGPVAIEAALTLPGRVIGVVGIDTFQGIGHPATPEYTRLVREATNARAETFRKDYPAAMHAMVKALFHADADPAVMADAERRMLRTPPETAASLFAGIADYDVDPSARRLSVPLRAINGDIYPTAVEKIRTVKPDFDVVVMKHMGHYPMLERPDEFNSLVRQVAESLAKHSS